MRDLASSHRMLYKRKNRQWKETYRQRFRERIKECRGRLVAQNRSYAFPDDELPDDHWYEQWMHMNQDLYERQPNETPVPMDEDQTRPPVSVPHSSQHDGDVQFLFQLMEEVANEIEQLNQDPDLYLESEDYGLGLMDDENTSVCPVCKMNFQIENTSQLICWCSLQIDMELDKTSLCHLRHRLNEGVSRHVDNCSSHVAFSISTVLEYNSIQMTCSLCNFVFEVI